MKTFYKILEDGYVSTGKIKLDETWLEITKNAEGIVIAPVELVNQISKKTTDIQTQINSQNKQKQLNSLIVIVSTAKRFYADPESRTDIVSTLFEATSQGATDTSVTQWKTADGIMEVTLAELKEANKLALDAKAGIIGVI